MASSGVAASPAAIALEQANGMFDRDSEEAGWAIEQRTKVPKGVEVFAAVLSVLRRGDRRESACARRRRPLSLAEARSKTFNMYLIEMIPQLCSVEVQYTRKHEKYTWFGQWWTSLPGILTLSPPFSRYGKFGAGYHAVWVRSCGFVCNKRAKSLLQPILKSE